MAASAYPSVNAVQDSTIKFSNNIQISYINSMRVAVT